MMNAMLLIKCVMIIIIASIVSFIFNVQLDIVKFNKVEVKFNYRIRILKRRGQNVKMNMDYSVE